MDSGAVVLAASHADRTAAAEERPAETIAGPLPLATATRPLRAERLPRGRRTRVSVRTLGGLTLFTLLSAGCSRQDTLQPVESIAIGSATLVDLLDEDEIVWLSGQGAPVGLRLAAGAADRVEGRFGEGVRVLGAGGGQLLLLRGRALLSLHPDSSASYRLLEGVETAVLAPAHDLLLQSIRDGEIVATPLDDLHPAWGWAGVGAASTALAVSPEGDRLYQALNSAEPDHPPRLLFRDLLSGRILKTIDLEEPIRALAVTAAGEVITMSWDGDRSNAAINRLAWDGGELRTAWISEIPAPASAADVRLAITPDGRRIAVVGANNEAGLTLLDGETGSTIADFDAATRDATFDDQGRLYAVMDSAVLRLE